MRARHVSAPSACERTAQLVSLDLDGELSDHEAATLERHLQHCETCAEYARSVSGTTGLLRAAPLEEFRLPVPLVGRRRRVYPAVRSVSAVAAVAVVAVSLSISFSRLPQGRDSVRTFNPRPVAIADGNDWAAGLPQTEQVVQLSPGGLRTSGVTP